MSINQRVGQYALKSIVAYNRLCIQTKVKCRMLRKQNAILNTICLIIENIFAVIGAFIRCIIYNRFEPSAPIWISTCKYIQDGCNTTTQDNYVIFNEDEFEYLSKHLFDTSENADITTTHDIFCGKPEKDTLIIANICPNKTIVRFAKNMDKLPQTTLPGVRSESSLFESEILHNSVLSNISKSHVIFLEIEYSFRENFRITIELPKSQYIVGNEVLSKTYILRYLEHLPLYVNWSFNDTEYSLRIIDDDSNVFTIKSNQYIQLGKDDYNIIDTEN